MAKQRMWLLRQVEDDLWHAPSKAVPSVTRCNRSCAQVRRVSTTVPDAASIFSECAVGIDLNPPRATTPKPKVSKAVAKKAAELRAQGVRAELAESLAIDALSRSSSRSVRALGGGLPGLGKGHK